MSSIKVVSSLDSHFAIAEAFSDVFRDAHEIRICQPWFEAAFLYIMKRTVPSNASLSILVRAPEEHDKTFRAIEALETEGRKKSWKTDVVCVPNLHSKFTVVNNRHVLIGSPNATNYGLYHNHEILVAFSDMPTIANRFREIFEYTRRQEYNHHWELVKNFHGASGNRRLVEATLRSFRKIANREMRIPSLISELQRHGVPFRKAKEGFQQMLNHGVLYSPREGFVRLVPKYEF